VPELDDWARQPFRVVNTVPGSAGPSITSDSSLSGFTGGFDAGCNWQVGGWVFDVEIDPPTTSHHRVLAKPKFYLRAILTGLFAKKTRNGCFS
jgi:hypothetical protein